MMLNVTLPSARRTPLAISRQAALALAGALALVSIAPPALASPESEAKDLFARGRELRTNGDCGSAAPLFRKAWTIYPAGLGSLRNLAECEEQLGHFASARRSWLDLKRALLTAAPDQKYDGWDADAEQAATRLKPMVATFVVDVYVKGPDGEFLANDASGVEIFVNGESVGTSLVGTPLERDPGKYRIRAQTQGAKPVEQLVPLSAGDNPHVTIRLTKEPVKLAVVNPADDHSTRRTIGWVVTGVGAASLLTSGITFLIRNGAKSDVDDQCPSHTDCNPSLQSTVDKGKTMSTLTSIFLPVGIVGVAAGVTLILTSKSTSSESKPTAWVTVDPSLGGMHLAGAF
jgi:hypothetical protein